MIITNKNNLPSALVNLAQDRYEPKAGRYSTTTLLNPTRMIVLERRYHNEIVVDVADLVWLIFGTAVHKVLEEHDKTDMAEIKFEQEIFKGVVLSGKIDLYNKTDYAIEDYKTASVWKVKFADFEDWKKQGLIYAWLAMQEGFLVKKIKFHALLKDWTARELRLAKLKGDFYPETSIWTWEHDITINDLKDIENFIFLKLEEILIAEKMQDDELPLCTDEERWYSGDTFAVIKKGGARALRVLDNMEDAENYLKNKGGDYIEKRVGENKRCKDYCDVCKFCNFYKEEVESKE